MHPQNAGTIVECQPGRFLPWLYKSGFYKSGFYKSGDLFVDELDQPGAIHTEVVEYDFAGRINQD